MNMTEKEVYHDNFFDRLCIWLFSLKMSQAVGKKSKQTGYDGFVDLSKQIMIGRNAQQQQEIVATVLKSLVPSAILYLSRTFFSPNRWVCESNAWFAQKLFQWLVGYCDVTEVEFLDENQQLKTQKSCLHIRKCRYLENSGCVGMCVNMCKLPTQKFFTESFGIPVTMTPNFEDFSCEMIFGKVPLTIEDDPVYDQECILDHCKIIDVQAKSCPKLI